MSKVFPTTSTGTPNEAFVPEYGRLRNALHELNRVGSTFIDVSRYQLALSTLRSKDPVLRIACESTIMTVVYRLTYLAVHGLDNQESPRKLAWALLADPLGEEAEWESTLLKRENGSKPCLLR